MTNATLRANAQTLPEATNRRAVLGAVLAAGALGATAVLPAYAATGPAALSATDRRVLDLWQPAQPDAGRPGTHLRSNGPGAGPNAGIGSGWPKYVFAAGNSFLYLAGGDVGWPEVADLDQQPVDAFGRILARPNVEDLYDQFKRTKDNELAGGEAATRGFLQALLAHDARVKEQEAEKDRAGFNRLNARSETGWSIVRDIEEAIKACRSLGSRGRREPDDRHPG